MSWVFKVGIIIADGALMEALASAEATSACVSPGIMMEVPTLSDEKFTDWLNCASLSSGTLNSAEMDPSVSPDCVA